MRIWSRPSDTGGVVEAVNRLARSISALAAAITELARVMRVQR